MSVGDLATILTVAGVSIYVLGLIGLAIPIRRSFNCEISTAWYAVALVPKTVVAGQGVRLWLLWPGTFAALLLLETAVLRYYLPLISSRTFFYVTAIIFLIIAGITIFDLERGGIQPEIQGFWRWLISYVFLLMAPLFVGVSLASIGLSMLTYPEQADILLEGVPFRDWLLQILYPKGSDPPVLRSIVIVLIGSFVFGLPFAISASPPLPKVRITKPRDFTIEGVSDPPGGWPLAHNDGFWHLFPGEEDEELRNLASRRDLISIPDDKVLIVRTLAKPDTEDTEAPQEPVHEAPQESMQRPWWHRIFKG